MTLGDITRTPFEVWITVSGIFYSVHFLLRLCSWRTRGFPGALRPRRTQQQLRTAPSPLESCRTPGTNTASPPCSRPPVYCPHFSSRLMITTGQTTADTEKNFYLLFSFLRIQFIFLCVPAELCMLGWFLTMKHTFASWNQLPSPKTARWDLSVDKDNFVWSHVWLRAFPGSPPDCCPCQIKPNIAKKARNSHLIKVLCFIMYIIIRLYLICNSAAPPVYAECDNKFHLLQGLWQT